MTAISTRAVRSILAAGAVSLGLVTLSGCQQPTPNAHFTLGSSSSSPEAAEDCYGEGELLPGDRARACLDGELSGSAEEDAPSFTVRAGDTFRVGVDPEIAETGWLLFVNGQPYSLEPITGTYRSFDSADLFAVGQGNQSRSELPSVDLVINVAQVGDDYEVTNLQSQTQEEFAQKLFASFEGVWNARLETED